MMMFSISSRTLQTYTSGWHQWLDFVKAFNFHKFLLVPPPKWPKDAPYPFQPSAISAFITYAYFQLKLQPSTITSYITGIKFFITNEGIDTSFFSSRIISSTKSAIILHFRSDHPISDTATFPFTLDLIYYIQYKMLQSISTKNQAIITGIQLEFSCLMRISEYIDILILIIIY